MRDITLGGQSRDHGLMPGMRRASVQMPDSVIRRVRDVSSRPRETLRIEPFGSKRETLIGRVTAVHTVDLGQRLGIKLGSVGAQLVGGRFPGLEAVQITILVDDVDIDPAAVDLLSYTLWGQVSDLALSLKTQDIVWVEMEPAKILGGDSRWIVESLEIL